MGEDQVRLAQCPRWPPGVLGEPRAAHSLLTPSLASHSLCSCSLRLQRLLWQTGWAVGINSSTFMLRSREVNSFPARAGEVGGESHPAQGRAVPQFLPHLTLACLHRTPN